MTINQQPLDKDLIAQPHLWRLVMLVGPTRLEVLMLPPVESEEAVYRSISLDGEAESQSKAVEDAIYANPLLLSDFKSVTCLVDTPSAMAVPTEISPADYDLLCGKAFGVDDPSVVVSPTGTDTAVMLMSVDARLRGFVSRTFYNVRFAHHLAPLCRYLAAVNGEAGVRLYALLRSDAVDVVALDGRRLLCVNTFECGAAADAVYYILAVARLLGIEEREGRIVTGGQGPMATEAEQMLDGFMQGRETLSMPLLKFRYPSGGEEIPLQMLCE